MTQPLCTKMSLGSTFRLYAIFVLVIAINKQVASFTLKRTTVGTKIFEDLAQEESVILKIKDTLSRPRNSVVPNKIKTSINHDNTNDTKHLGDIIQKYQVTNTIVNTEKTPKSSFKEITVTATVKQVNDTTINIPSVTGNLETDKPTLPETTPSTHIELDTVSENLILKNQDTTNTESVPVRTTKNNELFDTNDLTTLQITRNDDHNIIQDITESPMNISSSNDTTNKISINVDENITNNLQEDLLSTTPDLWKKYSTIERKRIPATTQISLDTSNNDEDVIKTVTVQSLLQNVITSDIPSLEQLKKDLLSSTTNIKSTQKPILFKEILSITQQMTNVPEAVTAATVLSNLNQSSEILVNKPIKWETVESKRAGYLDFSEKLVPKETNMMKNLNYFTLPAKSNEHDTEITDSDAAEEKPNKTLESQSQLNEDAIKEELLKEALINNNAENSKRREETSDKQTLQYHVEPKSERNATGTRSNETNINNSTDDILKVKPINFDKVKNLTLYTVSPNYKPLKKLEVQPPKQFIRDPDDNSWRNESIISLGIVFNPKNSSKPFTQVLKNKTETEWNNILDRDIKNDVPDLRERLEKMAKIRKIKKKKTDALGNVYFEYEDNSSSGENSPTATSFTSTIPTTIASAAHITEEINEIITAAPVISKAPNVLPATQKPNLISTKVKDIVSATTETSKIQQNEYINIKKPQKHINLPEYFESIDEEDIDYLNLAKIDLKKHITSKPKNIVSTKNMKPFFITLTKPYQTTTNIPEKLPSLQYFPPLTTQKVSMDEYDTDFKIKLDSLTTQEPLKNVLPISLPITTLPVITDSNPKYLLHSGEKQKTVINKPLVVEKDQYLNKSPFNKNEYTVINDENNNNKDPYFVKNYADFVHQAAKDSEFDRNLDLLHYTSPPLTSVSINDVIKPDKENPKFNDDFDYEAQFRKDVLDRFVDNFNRNSNRFKSNFPVLFNSSIVHEDVHGDGRDVASSRAFMRGLYGVATPVATDDYHQKPPYDSNCENVTVELSPAYELHYYIPEQEEKEEADSNPVTLPYRYKL